MVLVPSPASGLATRLRTGLTWNLIAAVFTQGATFAVNIAIANLLGRQIFGEYAMIQSTVLTLATVAQLATGYTATKYVAEFRVRDPERAGSILGLCSIVSAAAAGVAALALAAAAPWLAAAVLHAPHLTAGLGLASVVVFFTAMNGYQIGALAGLESYRALAVAGAIGGVGSAAICTVAAWSAGLNGALAGLGLGAFCQWVVLRRWLAIEAARHGIAIGRHSGPWRDMAILWKFALPATLSGFVSLPALWLASTFLVRQPGGYEQMALYVAASNFRTLVLFVPNVINNVGMSLLNNQKGSSDDRRYRKVFWTNLGLTAGAVVTGATAVVLLGPWLLTVFGRGFVEGYPVLALLMLSTIPEAVGAATYQVVQAEARIWLSLFAIVLPRDAALAILSYVLSPSYGALGLAAAYTLAWTLAFGMYVYVARKVSVTSSLGMAEA
jgi:O-antigen/teichoic acid export membrane protein